MCQNHWLISLRLLLYDTVFMLVFFCSSEYRRIPRVESFEAYRKRTQVGKKKWRPGTIALRQIRHYQKRTDFILPKMPLYRYVALATSSTRLCIPCVPSFDSIATFSTFQTHQGDRPGLACPPTLPSMANHRIGSASHGGGALHGGLPGACQPRGNPCGQSHSEEEGSAAHQKNPWRHGA